MRLNWALNEGSTAIAGLGRSIVLARRAFIHMSVRGIATAVAMTDGVGLFGEAKISPCAKQVED